MSKLRSVERKVDENENHMREALTEMEKQRVLDINAFADQSERADYGSNLLKANSVLVTGIMCKLFSRYTVHNFHSFIGLKADDFPKESSEQSARAVEMMRSLISRVLGREEEFTISVRKSVQRRYAKESSKVIVPPIEVQLK